MGVGGGAEDGAVEVSMAVSSPHPCESVGKVKRDVRRKVVTGERRGRVRVWRSHTAIPRRDLAQFELSTRVR